MAELKIHEPEESPDGHVVFVHGLGSNTVNTWSIENATGELWPLWLLEDTPGLGVGLIQYDTPRTQWRGRAMHLVDRAQNLLSELLSNSALSTGSLVLVGHSLGGLMIKQILRTAETSAFSDLRAKEFLSRLRAVVFYASPHAGSHLANVADFARFFVRPSAATACLMYGDANLRDLHFWFRDYVSRSNLKVLAFKEMLPMKFIGMVVTQESADAGVSRPIPVDADHVTITRLRDRAAIQYGELLNIIRLSAHARATANLPDLLAKKVPAEGAAAWSANALLGERHDEEDARILGEAAAAATPPTSSRLADRQLRAAIGELRRRRFYCASQDKALSLAGQVRTGDFLAASADVRGRALAWIARLLRTPEHADLGRTCLEEAERISSGDEIAIARATYVSFAGDVDAALEALAKIAAPQARTAAFVLLKNDRDRDKALAWLEAAKLGPDDFDGEGKFLVIGSLLDKDDFTRALDWSRACGDGDREAVPALNFICAVTEIAGLVPSDFRHVVVAQVPFEAADFPLASDPVSMAARRRAANYFALSARNARALGCDDAAEVAEGYALWLRLRDPRTQKAARQELRNKLRETSPDLGLVALALQFRLKVDLPAIEAEVDRQTALTGGGDAKIVVARFALAFTKGGPGAAYDYLDKHRSQIERHVPIRSLRLIEIEMLARAGKVADARELARVSDDLFDAEERARISRMFEEAQGADPGALREASYAASGQLTDLVNLVNYLETSDQFEKLSKYAEKLFEELKSLEAAETLGRALNNAGNYERLGDFLRSVLGIVDQSRLLQLLMAWTHFREGDFDAARNLVLAVRTTSDSQNARDLYVNIAISSGQWSDILPYLEEVWAKRADREPSELLRAASLAHLSGSPRSQAFAQAAVERGQDDAAILTGAYSLASSSGWEGRQDTAEWLRRAIELSDETGPIQSMSIHELVNQQPAWAERENEIWSAVAAGTMPLFMAGKGLRRSLLELTLLPALANLEQIDPRRWGPIPLFTGSRSHSVAVQGTIALDVSALITLAITGTLPKVLSHFSTILLPHGALAWLFEEKQKAPFHQPSRVAAARELRDLLATDALAPFVGTTTPDVRLVGRVGAGLAALLAEAKAGEQGGSKPRFVVRSYPVHVIGSLMDEEADLSDYGQYLVSCSQVVRALRERGHLTSQEADVALAHLSAHEKEWPNAPAIPDGADLYLDDLSVDYLQHVGALEKLRDAGFSTAVSPHEIAEANALLQYEKIADAAVEHIETIRSEVAKAVSEKRLRFEKLPARDADDENGLGVHPTVQVLASSADYIVVDDRSLNRHTAVGTGGAVIASSLSLLENLAENSILPQADLWAARTKLRLAGVLFVDIDEAEISHYLSAVRVVHGEITENAELRAIRSNLLKVRMSTYLNLPNDGEWLQDMNHVLRNAITAAWTRDLAVDVQRAISSWLFRCCSLEGWLHTSPASDSSGLTLQLLGDQVALLLTVAHELEPAQADAYRDWIDEFVIAPIQSNHPGLMAKIDERLKRLISSLMTEAEL